MEWFWSVEILRFTPIAAALAAIALLTACQDVRPVETVSRLSPATGGLEHVAMLEPGQPAAYSGGNGSLWAGNRGSLLGDKRALLRGDILTVVVEIDDRAEMSNSSATSRSAAENLGVGSLFGIPQRIDKKLPDGASMSSAVGLTSDGNFSGDGSVRRNEKLTLRVAATVLDVLPNGILRIRGSQEVRVNVETRELLVEGYVRAEDITRQNEITYDKIASARISYGGRGLISGMQTPRYGQDVLENILPF